MSERDTEQAILEAMQEYEEAFPVSGGQLAEKLQLSPQVIYETAKAMSVLPPKGNLLISVVTEIEPVTERQTDFYVQLQHLETD
ncbi:MAG: hypothetical protein P4L48_23545 [Mycobacterium sp.]|nr:hypothetical protein [Mycobacterium sp.]MDR3662018.1 hypothetical protein [Mycobacterium sp.]